MWDAKTYDAVSDPQVEMARPVLERLPLTGDETVLDAGCGSGRVTELLLDRLPRGRVIAVDADAAMVAPACARSRTPSARRWSRRSSPPSATRRRSTTCG